MLNVYRRELSMGRRSQCLFFELDRAFAVDRDEARANRHMADYFGHHYGVALERAVQVSITGSPEKCIAGPTEVINAGAGMLMLNPAFDYQEQMEALAQEASSSGLRASYRKLQRIIRSGSILIDHAA